jgi:hypothetical protein
MALLVSELAMEEGTLPAVSGVWICEDSDRAFAVTYVTAAAVTSEERLAAFERYLEGLICH